MGFGLAFAGAWVAANQAVKGAAAAIATGAKAVGQIPVAKAALENKILSTVQTVRETVVETSEAVRKAVSVKSTEWIGAMDVKAAELLESAGLPVNANTERMQAALATLEKQRAWEKKQADTKAALRSRREQVEAANAKRSAAAQQLKRKIAEKGKAAADAINNARKAADALLAKGILRTGWAAAGAIKKLSGAVKAKFGKAPVSAPSAQCPRATANRLRNRIAEQEELLENAKAAAAGRGPNAAKLAAAIPALEKQIDVNNKALMAADVYNEPGGDPNVAPGWTRLSDAQIRELGLDPNDFHPNGSAFRAAIYRNGDRYTVAFKGTTMDSEQDWENNLLQGLGLKADYYDRAQQLAKTLYNSDAVGPNRLEITGHSLGGGLASAAVARINDPRVRAATFNAAGLNPETVPSADMAQIATQIDAYQVDGEILTTLQGYTSATGVSPKAVGKPVPLPSRDGDSMVDKHLMEAVEDGLLEQGAKPESAVRSLLGYGALATA